MSNFCGSIYAEARVAAGYTQELAAPLIGIGDRSLSDYERGKTYCPDAIVIRMMELYQAEWLGWAHLQQNNVVGQLCLPVYEQRDAAQALLLVQRESRHVDGVMPHLVDVCSDGKVGHEERPIFQVAAKELKDMAAACMSLIFSNRNKKEEPSALAGARRLTS